MKSALPDEITASEEAGGPPERAAARPLLSLVIPVRNVAATLPSTLDAITSWIADSGLTVEVLVVDDASEDGTRATASAFARRIERLQVLRHLETRGQFEAIRTAEQACGGTLVAFGRDGEIPASLEACGELMGAIMDGADLAVLSTHPEGGLAESCRDWIRTLLGSRETRSPAFVMCRASALRSMMCSTGQAEQDAEMDWFLLARRAKCGVSVVRPGSPSSHPRPLPAPQA
jgi:glycosyltransferase involved in cell wall biosynthesis